MLSRSSIRRQPCVMRSTRNSVDNQWVLFPNLGLLPARRQHSPRTPNRNGSSHSSIRYEPLAVNLRYNHLRGMFLDGSKPCIIHSLPRLSTTGGTCCHQFWRFLSRRQYCPWTSIRKATCVNPVHTMQDAVDLLRCQ